MCKYATEYLRNVIWGALRRATSEHEVDERYDDSGDTINCKSMAEEDVKLPFYCLTEFLSVVFEFQLVEVDYHLAFKGLQAIKFHTQRSRNCWRARPGCHPLWYYRWHTLIFSHFGVGCNLRVMDFLFNFIQLILYVIEGLLRGLYVLDRYR